MTCQALCDAIANSGIPEKTHVAFSKIVERNLDKTKKEQPKGWRKMKFFKPYLFNPGFVTRIGTIMFGFVFNDSLFSIYNSLETPSRKVWKKTSIMGLSFMWLFSVVFPIICVMAFGTNLPENILTSDPHDLPVFPLKSRMAEIMQIAFGIVLMLTYPIISIITREYIESVIIQCQSGSPKDTDNE